MVCVTVRSEKVRFHQWSSQLQRRKQAHDARVVPGRRDALSRDGRSMCCPTRHCSAERATLDLCEVEVGLSFVMTATRVTSRWGASNRPAVARIISYRLILSMSLVGTETTLNRAGDDQEPIEYQRAY